MKRIYVLVFSLISILFFSQNNEKLLFNNFLYAIKQSSTLDYFIVVKVKNLNTNEIKEICTQENFLKGAIHRELNIDYTKEGQRKVYEYLKNKNKRYFEFRSKEALENISFDKYDNHALLDFKENYDLEKIISIIRNKKQITYFKFKNNEKLAMLHLLFNKGFLMNESSCFGGTLYLVGIKSK